MAFWTVTTAALVLLMADVCFTGNTTMPVLPSSNTSSISSSSPSAAPSTTVSTSRLLPLALGFLTVHWTIVPDVQLQTYKVMTALFCCVLVIILLIRFSRPTVKALQKRLSDRRQNRWIGPTQSHSVSYHRGKTVTTNDGEKRLSYPALERLMVSDSREPSSNRNSGYNF